eukprot:2075794-Rhodomonas_salina.2
MTKTDGSGKKQSKNTPRTCPLSPPSSGPVFKLLSLATGTIISPKWHDSRSSSSPCSVAGPSISTGHRVERTRLSTEDVGRYGTCLCQNQTSRRTVLAAAESAVARYARSVPDST